VIGGYVYRERYVYIATEGIYYISIFNLFILLYLLLHVQYSSMYSTVASTYLGLLFCLLTL
jgi:hypothetical protein